MDPHNPSRFLFDQPLILETPTGCLVAVTRSVPAAAVPLFVPDEPPPSPCLTLARVSEVSSNICVRSGEAPGGSGGASFALLARRRRNRDDPTEQTSPAALDVIRRFQMIIGIVGSTGGSARSRTEIGDLLTAVQRLKLGTGEMQMPPPPQKRRRCPAGSESPGTTAGPDGRSSASLLQETIAAVERMRLSEPVEHSEGYAEVMDKLKELLRNEEEEDG
uniref:Siroheme synthase n=1 Tax=Anthurium amnicola TaxID=1678845 RepID=A0A1D1YPZ2_9ARAE